MKEIKINCPCCNEPILICFDENADDLKLEVKACSNKALTEHNFEEFNIEFG